MTQILWFGDSVTQGYTDEFGGWTQRLRRYLDARYVSRYNGDLVPSHDVFNLGISGDTSAGLLRRMEREIGPRLLSERAIIMIAVGTNDSVFGQNSEEVDAAAGQFRQNLEQLVTQAKGVTGRVILVGLLPCDEAKMQPMPWSTSGKSYSNERLSEFNQIVVETAKKHEIPVIDIFSMVLRDGVGKYLADGIHPNGEGHTLIAYEVQPLVEHYLKF
jgi:acyl-CoA thioesterase-1